MLSIDHSGGAVGALPSDFENVGPVGPSNRARPLTKGAEAEFKKLQETINDVNASLKTGHPAIKVDGSLGLDTRNAMKSALAAVLVKDPNVPTVLVTLSLQQTEDSAFLAVNAANITAALEPFGAPKRNLKLVVIGVGAAVVGGIAARFAWKRKKG